MSNNQTINTGFKQTRQLIFSLFLIFFSIFFLIFLIYGILIYKNFFLFFGLIPVGIFFFIGVIFLFFYPFKIILGQEFIKFFFVFSEKTILWNEIVWAKKILHRLGLRGDKVSLLIILKCKGVKDLYVFRIYGKGLGLKGKEYITILDNKINFK